MGKITLKNNVFVVDLFLPGTTLLGRLLDDERLAIAVHLSPEAKMSRPVCVRVLLNPDPTHDYLLQSTLKCNASNVTALLATDFKWDEVATTAAEQYEISEVTVRYIRGRIPELHKEHQQKFWEWWNQRQARSKAEEPKAPWNIVYDS